MGFYALLQAGSLSICNRQHCRAVEHPETLTVAYITPFCMETGSPSSSRGTQSVSFLVTGSGATLLAHGQLEINV